MSSGKQLRLGRLFAADRRTVIVPVDQSITSGPIRGLEHMRDTLRSITSGGPDAVIMHRGPAMAGIHGGHPGTALILHLSAGTELSGAPHLKTAVSSIEEALRLGADAVSVHVSLGVGAEADAAALASLDRCSTQCQSWGVPLLAMMYAYGQAATRPRVTAHAARIAADLGADIVKVGYTGDRDSFAEVVATCYVPVVMAGGPASGDGYETLAVAEEALAAGAAGVCAGRNVYQHLSPPAMLRALRAVVHHGTPARQAYEEHLASLGREARPHRVASERPSEAARPI